MQDNFSCLALSRLRVHPISHKPIKPTGIGKDSGKKKQNAGSIKGCQSGRPLTRVPMTQSNHGQVMHQLASATLPRWCS